jgi:hypothetical protein
MALVAAGAASAAAADLSLLFTSSANFVEGTVGGQSASGHSFNQLLDVNYNQGVTPILSYRLRLRGGDNESTASVESTSTSITNRFIEPSADATLAGSKYSLNAGVRLRQSFISGTEAQSLTLKENYEFIRAFFTPDLLPALNAQFERTATSDDREPTTLDQTVTRAVFGANYVLAQKVNLAYTFTRQENEDNVAQTSQVQQSQVATASYSDSFFSNRLSVNGNYLFTTLDLTQRFAPVAAAPGGALVLLPVVLSGAFGLTEFDSTVAASNKVPPVTYTTLTTNTSITLGISAPLIVDDGGTPNKNASIAFGLAPGASVSTVRLTVSPRAGDTRDITQQAAGVTFQMFVGTDPQVNQTGWSQVAIASVTPPTTFNPFFQIAFAATGGTFLKVHVARDTQQPLFQPLTATAISAFASAAAGGGGGGGTRELTTSNTLQSVSGGITAQPFAALSVSANGTFTTNKADPSGRRDDSGTYAVSATAIPHRLLTATGTYQATFSTSNDPLTLQADTRLIGLTLTSTPLPTLTASLSGSQSENDLGGITQTRTNAISLSTALQPYRNLNVNITTTSSWSNNFVDGTKTSGMSGSINANGVLTDRLTGLIGYAFGRNVVTGGAAPSPGTTNTAFLSLTYTVSRLLNLIGRWDFTSSPGADTISQSYRLDLIPTPKTSLLLNFQRIDQSVGGVTSSSDAATAILRWNISRYLDLSVTGNVTRSLAGDTIYGIFGTLAFRL